MQIKHFAGQKGLAYTARHSEHYHLMLLFSNSLSVQGGTVKTRMGASYSSTQYGVFNFSVSSLNIPSILLGVILVAGIYLMCKFKSSCRVFSSRHSDQSTALTSIAKVETAHIRPMASHAPPSVTLVPNAPARKLDPVFLDL